MRHRQPVARLLALLGHRVGFATTEVLHELRLDRERFELIEQPERGRGDADRFPVAVSFPEVRRAQGVERGTIGTGGIFPASLIPIVPP